MRVQLALENVSAPTGGLVAYRADSEDGYSCNSEVVFLLLVNETYGDQLSLTFGDGRRHLVNNTALKRNYVLPPWVRPRLRKLFPYRTGVSHVYRRPGTYEVSLMINDTGGNALELSQTTISIDFEEIELRDLEIMTCVDDDGTGTILISSGHRLCDVVAEWSYDNQLFIDLVSFSEDQLPVWAASEVPDNATLYASTLTCRNAVAETRKEFVVALTGRVFNTTYKFATTRLVDMRPVSVELGVAARRVDGRRAAVLSIRSVDKLENLHVTATVADDLFAEYVELNPLTVNGSVAYETNLTLNLTLPVPERITAIVAGTKDGACFIVTKTADVADRSRTKYTDFEVFSHVDDADNAAVVLLAGRRVNDVRVSWGSDDVSFVRTVVDLVPDERPPLWLSTDLGGYYTATLTHRFAGGSPPNTSLLTIVEHADDSFAVVKLVHLRRPPQSGVAGDGRSPPSSSSSDLSAAQVPTSACDPRQSDAVAESDADAAATEPRRPVDRNVYVTTTSDDDDGTVTLQFYARHPVRNMIVDWNMPGTASRRVIDLTQPAGGGDDVDGYYTATIQRSFDVRPPNTTKLRMTGRIEGSAFDIAKTLDHALRPPAAGFIATLPVFPAPVGFAGERQTAFHVASRSHYVTESNVTIPARVMSRDRSLTEVLVIDVTCSVRQAGSESTSATPTNDHCAVALDRINGSLILSVPGTSFSAPGRYDIQIQVSFSPC